MIVFIGMDDTDNRESRGTGHLARTAAERLSAQYDVLGVVRHQLFFDPRVPYTKNNSSCGHFAASRGMGQPGSISSSR